MPQGPFPEVGVTHNVTLTCDAPRTLTDDFPLLDICQTECGDLSQCHTQNGKQKGGAQGEQCLFLIGKQPKAELR